MNEKNLHIYFLVGILSLSLLLIVNNFIQNQTITANAVNSNYASGKNSQSAMETEVNEELIEKVLKKLDADELHPPLFSSNNPKLEIKVDNLVFGAEVNKGSIKVNKGNIESEDIVIYLTKEKAIEIANNGSPEKIIRSGVTNGEIKFQILTSKSVLFSKGYLSLYNKFS